VRIYDCIVLTPICWFRPVFSAPFQSALPC